MKTTDNQHIKTEVIVLGTIHSQHLTSKEYSLKALETMIKTINPDYILAEMPPDRFEIAASQYAKTGTITEPRILQYPEFSRVVFPLQRTMNFQLKPVSAWTVKMADDREEKLVAISKDPNRAADWNTYLDAREKTSELFEKEGHGFDIIWLHSDRFDEILETELSVFNRLFNDDLGAGGWENINNAHYALIDKALTALKNKGKRVLIMFGTGHKGWLLRKLKTRTDIELKPLLDVL